MDHSLQTGHLLCLLPFPEPKAVIDRIKHRYPQLKVTYRQIQLVVDWKKGEGVPDDLWEDVTVLYTFSQFPPRLDLAPKLQWVHLFTSGTDHVRSLPIYKDSAIPLTTCTGVPALMIAEWITMSILVASRKYNMLRDWQLRQAWDGTGTGQGKAVFTTVSSTIGKTMGILGYGAIGRQMAKISESLGMKVLAYTASPRDTPESKRYDGFSIPGIGDPSGEIPALWFSGTDKASIHEFLNQGLDYLLISIPLNAATEGLLGKEEFQILSKRSAFIVNVSRGETIVQDDLIEALNAYNRDPTTSNGLSGAVLDVTTPEPLPPDHPLWTAPNCIVSPHISGNTREYGLYAGELLEENLRRLYQGERLLNAVDRSIGYSSARLL